MKIERIDTDTLTAQLQLSLSPEDYKAKFEEDLAKQSKTLKMKGFRKGKVPKNYLKKMFGKSVLADVVLKEVNQGLAEYIDKENLRILGSPLSSEDQKTYDFDPFELSDFEFHFDVGFEPEFELKGVNDGTSYLNYKLDITDKMVDEEWESMLKRMGKQADVDEDIKEGDRVILDAKELDGKKVKEDGWQTEVTVLVDMIADDKVKKAILKSKKGDKITFEASKLEKDTSEHYVKKHILKIEDEDMEVGDKFEGEIKSVMRVEPAEVNEDLFKAFGEDIKTEEDARGKLTKDLEGFFNRQSEALLYREVQDRLLEMNEFEMPKGFLKRWLLANDEKLAERETLDQDVDSFIKSMRWTLIKRKLQREGDIQITHGEILDHFVQQIRNYMGGYGADEAFLLQTARQLMDNQEQVSQASERILDDKVFEYISDKIGKDDKVVSREELNEIIQKVNQS